MSSASNCCAALAAAMAAGLASSSLAGPPMSALLDPPPPAHVAVPPGVLRVCSDPNNLPFSNRKEQGFENRIARILGRELHRKVEYTWWPQRRGFIRKTLKQGLCDVVIGVPANYELTENTPPYYRSTYVFVMRRDQRPPLTSIDDERLRALKIGVTVIGDDYANLPPVQALAARGMATNVRGFSIYGDYSKPNPPRAVIDAVADRTVDVAVAWGPLAGYFASREAVPLVTSPIAMLPDMPQLPMAYDIAVGVRHGDHELRRELEQALVARRKDIGHVLADFRVPVLERHEVASARAGG